MNSKCPYCGGSMIAYQAPPEGVKKGDYAWFSMIPCPHCMATDIDKAEIIAGLNYKPHKLQMQFFDTDKRYTFIGGGRRGGRNSELVTLAKAFPNMKVICKSIQNMDNLIHLGVQPSQIILSSELTNNSTLIRCGIDHEM